MQTPEGLSELTLDFTTLSIVAGGNDYLSSVMDVRNLRTFTSADNGTRRNIWDQYLAHRADTGCGPLVQRSPAEDGAGGSEWGCWTAPLAVNLPALLAVMRASRGLQGFAPKASHTDFLPRHERGQTYLKVPMPLPQAPLSRLSIEDVVVCASCVWGVFDERLPHIKIHQPEYFTLLLLYRPGLYSN